MTVLPDVLASNLKVVFCDTAAGTRSAYYGGRANRFWEMLHQIGLTPWQLEPAEFHDVLKYGIGLTDIAKLLSGPDTGLPKDAFDIKGLRGKIEHFKPRILAFNGKTAARVFLGRGRVDYGLQADRVATTKIFVCPSTLGLAARSWDPAYWHELAKVASRV